MLTVLKILNYLKFRQGVMKSEDLFIFSLKNQESLIDDAYCHNELIIPMTKDETNSLTQANRELLEQICAIKWATDNNQPFPSVAVDNIICILDKTENINYCEFVSFFPTLDVSFSIYEKLTNAEKIDFIKIVAERYIIHRHNIYTNHGYTDVTIQARKDFEKHKVQGNLGYLKIKGIMQCFGYVECQSHDEFTSQTFCNIESACGKIILEKLLDDGHCQSYEKWQAGKSSKQADVIFQDKNGQIYIMELKHVKEGGGGQDKQIAEIIDLIRGTDSGITYVAYLDGIYSNILSESYEKIITKKTGKNLTKSEKQVQDILHCIQQTNNLFLNTAGFVKLLQDVQ